MLVFALLIIAAVCFVVRLLNVADGRATAVGGLLLCLALALASRPEVLSR